MAASPHAVTPRADASLPRWIEARCISYGENVPYGVVSELVASCLGLPAALEPHARLDALETRTNALFGDDVGRAVCQPRPPAVAAAPRGCGTATGAAQPAGAARPLSRRDRDGAAPACAAGPTIVVIEDAHWADASSVEVLGKLLPLAHEVPVLLILTSRPERGAVGWRLVETARETFGDALVGVPAEPTGHLVQPPAGQQPAGDRVPAGAPAHLHPRALGGQPVLRRGAHSHADRAWLGRAQGRSLGRLRHDQGGRGARRRCAACCSRAWTGCPTRHAGRCGWRRSSVATFPCHLLETITGDPGRHRPARSARRRPPAWSASPRPIPSRSTASATPSSRRRPTTRCSSRTAPPPPAGRRGAGAAAGRRSPRGAGPILGLHFERAGDDGQGVHYLHDGRPPGNPAARTRRGSRPARSGSGHARGRPETPEHERLRVEDRIDRAAAGVLAAGLRRGPGDAGRRAAARGEARRRTAARAGHGTRRRHAPRCGLDQRAQGAARGRRGGHGPRPAPQRPGDPGAAPRRSTP